MFSQLKDNQKQLVELIIATIILGIGLEFIASSLQEIFGLPSRTLLVVGLTVVTICSVFIILQVLGNNQYEETIDGFFVYKKAENTVIEIERYHYGRDLSMYLSAAFSENPAFKSMWEKEKLSDIHKRLPQDTESRRFIVEATEYFLLERLSTHLGDYFNQREVDSVSLTEFGREDVPDVLLKNRFMELFSRPIGERAVFLPHDSESHTNTIMMGGKNAFFSRFDLTLPAGSKVRRVGSGAVEIETNRLTLRFSIHFSGMGSVLPRRFDRYYLREGDFSNLSTYKVKIKAAVELKRYALFTRSGWEMYYWSESFIDSFRERFSKDFFFEKIGWEHIQTLLQCTEHPPAETVLPREIKSRIEIEAGEDTHAA